MIKYGYLAVFILTIPAANWLISNIGTVCVPNGPCWVPVAPGLMAPSGVLMIGLALVMRVAVHEHLGAKWAAGAIVVGAIISGVLAPAALVIASATAWLFAEAADMAVYTPLRKRNIAAAVMMSGIVGAVADSVLFLWLAFGSLDFLAGQVVAKIYISAIVAVFLWYRSKRMFRFDKNKS